MPPWFLIALSCAFFTASLDAVSKRIMRDNDQWITGTFLLGLGVLALLPIVLAMELQPVSAELVALLAVALPLEILAYYLFLSAIRIAPLSLTVPLLAFTPVFTILTAAILLGERVTPNGAAGIAMVTIGAYLLNADLMRSDLLAPVKAVFSNPGSRRMLAVAVIWSLTSALGKMGTQVYGAVPFGFVLTFGVLVVFALVSAVRVMKGWARVSFKGWVPAFLLLGGLLMGAAEISHFVALSMAPVAYMISVKRLSLVFGVFLGWLFFDELNIRYRITGASVMVAGVLLIYQ